MRSLHSGARATELDTPDTPPPPAQSGTEVSWSWVRPLLPEELERRYVHGYDKNGMYLAACASLDLGVGAAAHLLEGAASDAYFLDRAPGYYRVVGGDSRLSLLPNPLTIHRRPALEGGFWVTRPTLELLYEVDTPLHIAEAWAWTQRHQYLQPWYKRLRDGRKQLMSRGDDDTPAQIALAALKNTYTQAIGWLDGSWDREKAVDGHAGILYRPDWRHAIIAQSNANLYRRVHKWGQSRDCDFHPFAWVTDCVYIASNEANPELACPPDMTLGTGLGQFKVHDSVPMARVRDALASEKPSLRGFFDALAATRRTAERVTV